MRIFLPCRTTNYLITFKEEKFEAAQCWSTVYSAIKFLLSFSGSLRFFSDRSGIVLDRAVRGSTQYESLDDLTQCVSKALDAERVHQRVQGGVAVGHKDADGKNATWHAALWAEKHDAVHDVKWQPAESEQKENECQGLG